MILDQFELHGKVAVVTGSATGLGQGIAVGLAEAGADIAGVYNRRSPEETQSRLERLGGRFLGMPADLISIAPIQEIVKRTVAHFGHFDIAVDGGWLGR